MRAPARRRPALHVAAIALLCLAAAPAGAAEPAKPAAGNAPTPLVPAVAIKVSDAKGRTRLVLQWRQKVEYAISETADGFKIRFDHPATLDLAEVKAEAAALKPHVAKTPQSVTLSIAVPEGATLQDWRSGTSVVVEISPPPGAKPAEVAAAPAKPEPARAATAAPPAPKPGAPAAFLGPGGPPPPAHPVAKPPSPAPPVAHAEPPSPVAPPPQKTLPVRYGTAEDGARLRFEWAAPVGAAAFRRGADVWVVFDRAAPADLAEVRAKGRAGVSAIEQLANPGATVIRLATIAGFNPSLSRVGSAWIVDLRPRPPAAEAPIAVESQPAAQRVLFRLQNPSAPVAIKDPEHGDRLWVVPGGELGQGVAREQNFAEFRALPTVQGIALVPTADGIQVREVAEGAAVTREGGLSLSGEGERPAASGEAARLFDFASWGAGGEEFIARRRALEAAIAAAPAKSRTGPRLDLARFYFAEGYGAEALGVLDAVERNDPAALISPAFHALRGASALLANMRDLAAKELGSAALDGETEAALWRGSLAAAGGDWPEAQRQFSRGIAVLPSYPKALRHRFALEAAEATLNTGTRGGVGVLLRTVMNEEPTAADAATARFLAGRDLQLAGDIEGAIRLWDEVVASDNRRAKAHAGMARTLALLDSGRLSRADAVQRLDTLRHAWRGDEFEYQLLRRLGELQLKEGDFRAGFDSLAQATGNFPEYASRGAGQMLSDALAALFLGPDADNIPPLRALALFEEHRDLLPAGDRGDQIVQKLADRLVSVDLLDRAAALLEGQVKTRLAGKEKARVAARLAYVQLLDRKPQAALDALAAPVKEELPPELVQERRMLKARALADLGRAGDALAALAPETGVDADKLRATIYWEAQNWAEAAKTFARLAPPPPADGKLEDEAARTVVNWAAALSLAGDQAALAELWQNYQTAMEATPSRELFRVVAAQTPSASDIRAIASSVAQVSDLKSFMATYKDRLGAQKLSALN